MTTPTKLSPTVSLRQTRYHGARLVLRPLATGFFHVAVYPQDKIVPMIKGMLMVGGKYIPMPMAKAGKAMQPAVAFFNTASTMMTVTPMATPIKMKFRTSCGQNAFQQWWSIKVACGADKACAASMPSRGNAPVKLHRLGTAIPAQVKSPLRQRYNQ